MTYSIYPGLLYRQQKLGKLPNTLSLAGERRPVQMSHWPFLNSSSSMDTWGNLSNLWISCAYLRPRNPSWIWIRYIQYATTGTTLCHPQNWLCRCDAFIPLSTPSSQFTSGPLWWRQRTPSPQFTRHTKLMVTPKFISSNGNIAFSILRRTQSLTRPTIHAAFLNFLITPFHLLTHYETCCTNANHIFHAANKNYS